MTFSDTHLGHSIGLALALSFSTECFAVNPIIQTLYTADPAPLVHKDTVYLYTGHDEDGSTWFTMKDWRVYSSKDMVNWTDHGSPLSLKDFAWVKDSAWAGHTIERNGKFYWYVPVERKIGGMAIGVAVADSPTGPFKDALGKELVFDGFGDIDPAAFIDKNGQAYLVWGNPTYKYVKLNEDMVSYDTSVGDKGIFRGPMTVEAFGKRSKTDRETAYEEAPWIYQRGGIHYLFHAGGPVPEHLAYSTAPGAEGPWKYGGVFMPTQGGSFTNHPGVIDFKGKTYLFYHDGGLPGGGGFTRSVCVDELKFNPDGSIPSINMTREGPAPVATLDPYMRNEAETIAWTGGIETEPGSQGGMAVCDMDDGDFIEVKNVDFGSTGAGTFSASVSCETQANASKPATIELRLDSKDGALLGKLPVSYTGSRWKSVTASVSGAAGVRSLFIVFKGATSGDLCKFDHWQFAKKTADPSLVAIQATVDRYKIDLTPPGNRTALKVAAIYSNGTSRDVTAQAKVAAEKTGVVTASGGALTATAAGVAKLQVAYEGLTDTLDVIAKDLKTETSARRITASVTEVKLVSGDTHPITATVEFLDGHSEVVTGKADYMVDNPQVASVKDGVITATGKGATILRAVFKGGAGEAVSTPVSISVTHRDAFASNSFAKHNGQQGLVAEKCSEGGENLCDATDGEWVRFNGIDFGTGADVLAVRVASATQGGTLEVRLDAPDGPLVGTCKVDGTGGWQNWVTKTCEIKGASGTHGVLFKLTGGPGILFNLNWWKFGKHSASQTRGNPIFRTDAMGETIFTADPAVLVDGDTLYVYAGQDEAAIGGWFNMNRWVCYSTKDMASWKCEGVVMNATDFSWGTPGTAWACQVVKKNGKYYFFSTTGQPDKKGLTVGVAVSDSPAGPFVDVKKSPLFDNAITTGGPVDSIEDIDPTVFIDDDGQAYIYWGNGTFHYALLSDDLMSIKDLNQDGKITEGEDIFTDKEFGKTFASYGEAPWVHKRDGTYYLACAVDLPQRVVYGTSTSPRGPWKYQGVILGQNLCPDGSRGDFNSDTSHPAVVTFKGQSYVFYHNAALPTGGQTRRSVCVEKFSYNPDGTIKTVAITSTGVHGKAFRMQSIRDKESFLRFSNFEVKMEKPQSDSRPFLWDITPGLAGDDSVSIQCVAHPGYYLSVQGDQVMLAKHDGSDAFKRDATFKRLPVSLIETWCPSNHSPFRMPSFVWRKRNSCSPRFHLFKVRPTNKTRLSNSKPHEALVPSRARHHRDARSFAGAGFTPENLLQSARFALPLRLGRGKSISRGGGSHNRHAQG